MAVIHPPLQCRLAERLVDPAEPVLAGERDIADHRQSRLGMRSGGDEQRRGYGSGPH